MMAATKTAYTAEQSAELVAAYVAAPTSETVEAFAVKFGKSVKSIVAKLSREKVYVKKEYKTKTGESVQKKDTVADAIGAILQLSEPDTESLTKANKTALKAIFDALANSKPLE
jgi:K+/H+ antiporter YhaU regulatory subunit KhtT